MPFRTASGRRPARPRSATTLLELLLVLAMLAVVAAMAIPVAGRREDRRRAHGAALHAATVLGGARAEAVARGSPVAVALDTAAGILRVIANAGGDTLRTRDLATLFGVRLRATRDSLAYDARGLGVGAANLTLVFTRGAASETLVVSRLGRLRW
ncbi:MAG TPA: GspH/FimT family protein [Gemmatimonadaceae bacterium]